MRIAILGAGNVGGALGESWSRHGHQISLGVRNPDSPEVRALLQRCGPVARAASPAQAVQDAAAVVNALPWPATRGVLEKLDLAGKVLLDCTNPLKPDLSGLEAGTTTSGGEMVAGWARGAKAVKIFNSTGFANMTNPVYDGKPIVMVYCGDDAEAKRIAAGPGARHRLRSGRRRASLERPPAGALGNGVVGLAGGQRRGWAASSRLPS